MKTRKFLAVMLLLSMCFSFMTVSASADFSAHVNSDMFGDEPEAPVETAAPTEDDSEPEINAEPDADAEANADSLDAVIIPDEEPENSDDNASYEGSLLGDTEVILGSAPKATSDEVVEIINGSTSVTYTKWSDAMAAVKSGETVKLLKNVGFSSLVIDKAIILDLNGFGITITPVTDKDSSAKTAIFFTDGGDLKNGTINIETSFDEANNLTRYFGVGIDAKSDILNLKNVTINYEGGKNGEGEIFSGNVLAGKGCKLSKNPGSSFVDSGFKPQQNADGSYDIISTTPDAAKVNGVGYTYLTEALDAAKEGDTVSVLRDVNPPSGINFKNYASDLTLDLGGCKYTGDITVEGGKKLTITNGSVVGVIYTNSSVVIGSGAKVGDIYFNGGTLDIVAADASVKNIKTNKDTNAAGKKLSISGGSIGSIASGIDTEKVEVSVTGGTFGADPAEYVDKSNYLVKKGEDGLYTVSARPMVVKIGDTEYNTFGKARDAAKDGDELVLICDLGAADFDVDKNLILNLNGKTLKSNINILSDMTLTIKDGTLNGNITNNGGTADLQNAAVNTVDGYGTYKLSGSSKAVTLSPAQGELTISGSGVSVENLYIKGSEDLTMVIEGGSIGTFTKADKPEKVISRISGGVFGTDPSGYLAKGYFVEADKPEKGKFTVSAKEAATLTAPKNAVFLEKAADADMVFTASEDLADEVYVNGEKLVNDAKNTNYAVKGKELTLYKDYLNTLEAASYIVEVVPADNAGKPQASFVVMGTPTLKCESVPAVHVKGSGENLVFKSNYPIFKVSVDGKELGNDQFDYVSADKKTISLKAAYLDTFKIDEAKTLSVDVELTADKQSSVSETFKTVEKAPASISYSDGSKVDEIKFYKDKNDADKNKLFFKVSPKVDDVKIDGKSLAKSDYQNKADSVNLSESSFANLDAGRHTVTFVYSNGAEKNIKAAVYPSYVFNSGSHSKGSGKDLKVILSDNPDSIWAGIAADKLEKIQYTAVEKDGKYLITISSEELDKLPEGELIMSFEYDDVSAMISGFKNLPAPSIKPADTNKECKWAYGSSTLSFVVDPAVKSVSVDGKEISTKNYNVSKENVLTLTSAFLKSLDYGEHTLTVDTGAGEVSIKFTTKCGIEAKNGNTHTKGGKKNLEFISSDPIEKVIVGSETLKEGQYTLSKDGKTLTLKADFLNKLKADYTYELTVETEAGLAFTTFKILSPGSAASNPKTGDEGGMFIWAAVLVLSGAGALALIPRRKKQ